MESPSSDSTPLYHGYCDKKYILYNGQKIQRTCLIITSPCLSPSSPPSSSSSSSFSGINHDTFPYTFCSPHNPTSYNDLIFEIDDHEIYLPYHGPIRCGYLLQLIEYNLYIRTSISYQFLISIFRKNDVLRSLNTSNSLELTQQLCRIQYSTGTHPNCFCKLNTFTNLITGIYFSILDEMNCYLLIRLADIQIISSYQDRNVALPLDFMSPIIHEASCCQLNIIDIHGNSKLSTCIHSDIGITYEIDERIYKTASYGCIYRGWIVTYLDDSTYLRTTELYQIVIKRYSKQMMMETIRADNPLTEFAALQYIGGIALNQDGSTDHLNTGHPNVLGQLDCLEDDLYYYSIMKFCNGGELTEHIDSLNTGTPPLPVSIGGPNLLKERHVRQLFQQLLDGLEYLHARGIYHRDLSLENILITDNNHLLIIDLGMALWVPYETLIQTPHFIPKMDPPKGKKQYVSPEALANTHPFDPYRSDLWSVGIILFVLLCGRFPVQVASPLCPFYRCIAGGGIGHIFKKYNIQITREAMDLLAHMLNAEPMLRFTIDQIRSHPWMVGS